MSRGVLQSEFSSFPEAKAYAKKLFDANRGRLKTWVELGPRGFGVYFLRVSLNPGMRPHTPRTPAGRSGAYAIDTKHAHIGKGLIYCEDVGDAAAPIITHSRVKCRLCGKTIQSAHNPFTLPKARKPFQGAAVLHRPHSTARMRRSFKRNPVVNPGKSPAAHMLREEMMEGKTPAAALRAVARRLAGRIPRAALLGAFKAVREELLGGFEGNRSHMAEWAGMAGMRMGGYRKFSRNPARGASAVESPRLIYGRASTLSFGPDGKIKQMTSRKTSGPYKGKDFVHDFKPGVKHVGLPRGTAVRTPDGKVFKLPTRTALMVGPKNLWADFRA